MKVSILKQAFKEHSAFCTKLGCKLEWNSRIVISCIKTSFGHCITLTIPVTYHVDLYTFQRMFKGHINCKCNAPCSKKCVKFAIEFMCKSELTTDYCVKNSVLCVNSQAENEYYKAIVAHHSPLANYCISPFCLLTGKWKLAATHSEEKHFCLLKEDTLVSRENYPTAKCHLTVHNVLRGGCVCEKPFSEKCFAAFLTAFCKYKYLSESYTSDMSAS
ncbi:RH5 [Bovine adenovirus 6]|uniref:RH5 n=1 Tax=Bovine adenovirus 6 TaxID=111167 RepID=K9MNV3_9ADEN|nr:RH5 [Bovine adenovirus 6]AFV70655.1 RH5 [Bovine adenovirus 6]